ncbi:LOW QUALITY PROTEIN: transcriptional regulator, partial [Streptomyces sp. SPB78]
AERGPGAGAAARAGGGVERAAGAEPLPRADRAHAEGGGAGRAAPARGAAADVGAEPGGDGGAVRLLRPGPPERRVPGDDRPDPGCLHGGAGGGGRVRRRGKRDGRGGGRGARERPAGRGGDEPAAV